MYNKHIHKYTYKGNKNNFFFLVVHGLIVIYTSKTSTCKAHAWSENINSKTFKELHKK